MVEPAALDHEPGHHAVEQSAVVVAFLRILLEVGNADRCLGIVEFDDDGAGGGLDGGVIPGRQLIETEDGEEHDEDLRGEMTHRGRSFEGVNGETHARSIPVTE